MKARAYAVKKSGRWWARVVFRDSEGKRREKRQLAIKTTPRGRVTSTKQHAREIAEDLRAEIEATEGSTYDRRNATFNDFAKHYAARYMRDAAYDADGDKLDESSMLRPKTKRAQGVWLRTLCAYFGAMPLQEITLEHIRRYREHRYLTPTPVRSCGRCKGSGERRRPGRRPANVKLPPCAACGGSGKIGGKQRTWTSVHRELSLLRAMFNVAAGEDQPWIMRNPFARNALVRGRKNDASKLIALNKERVRDVTISFAEEKRLLAAIPDTTEGRRLRLIVVFALDAGMRLGEICHLDWSDVNLSAGHVDLRKRTTKTLDPRRVPLTPRMRDELLAWREHYKPSPDRNLRPKKDETPEAFEARCRAALCDVCGVSDAHILGNCENVGRLWRRVRTAAGLDAIQSTPNDDPQALHIHDLRHTCASRLAHGGMSGILVSRILGHASAADGDGSQQTVDYTSALGTMTATVAAALNRAREMEHAEHAESVN